MKNCTCFAVLALTIALLTVGCETDDVGKFCAPQAASIGLNPVDGENPAVEVSRIHRDESCQSFQCLEHLGLTPHCTRTCQLSPNATTCTSNQDCPNQGACIAGTCHDDGCPAGFTCDGPIQAGELAQQKVCVRRSDCNSNLECEGLGAIDCVELGCFDRCLLDNNCDMHQLGCEPLGSLACTCANGADDCTDNQLSCTPESGEATLVAGSVSTRKVCLVRDPPQ